MNSNQTTRRWLIFMTGCALAGAWASGTLLATHDGGWKTAFPGSSILLNLCNLQGIRGVNCEEVVASRWGAVDFSVGSRHFVVPTSWLGLAYFVSTVIWVVFNGRAVVADPRLRRCSSCLIFGGLAGSIFFVALMAFMLATWCPLCVVAHVCNGGIALSFIVLLRRHGTPEQEIDFAAERAAMPSGLARFRLFGLSMAAMVVSTVALWLYYDAAREARHQWRKVDGFQKMIAGLQADPDFVLREFRAQPIQVLRTSAVTPENERQDRPEIVVFTDFACPACGCFDQQWRMRFQKYFKAVPLVDFRPLLLSPPAQGGESPDQNSQSKFEMESAVWAQAARLQEIPDALDRFRSLVFRKAKWQDKVSFVELARQAGLDGERLQRDLSDPQVRAAIEANVEEARRLGVTATPAVFVNGRRVPDLCLTSQTFWQTIAAEFSAQPDRNRAAMAHPKSDGPVQP